MDNNFDFVCLCQVLTACKVSNKSNRRLLRYCTFIFSSSCSIASVTSYLSETEAENLQNGAVHLAQIPDFEMEYLENHLAHWGQWWLAFCIFRALSFELNFFFDWRFPLTNQCRNVPVLTNFWLSAISELINYLRAILVRSLLWR